jgi:glycosyltransferase involved in cell wall biosynthesis
VKTPTLSIITVTLNCEPLLPGLLESLLAQSDPDFEWIVVDGGSRDETLQIARRFPSARATIVSGRDFGIYDALNKGVAAAHGEYYLVVGADDRLYPDAIANYRKAAGETGMDIVAAIVDSDKGPLRPMRGRRWLRGGNAYIASHAVGTLIRRELHSSCGYYSNRYVNAADMHFILTAVAKGKASIGAAVFVAGKFDGRGVSTMDSVCSLSDAFRIQLVFGENRFVQLALYFGRMVRALLRS